MKKVILGLSIVLLIGIGCTVASGIMYSKNHDVVKELSGGPYEMKQIDDSNTISSLNIVSSFGKVELYDSEDGALHVEYPENECSSYKYENKNGIGTLKESVKSWRFSFNISDNKPTTKIYIPSTFDSFSFKQCSGSTVSYVTKITAKNITLENLSGASTLSNLETQEKIIIKCSSGDLNVSNVKANKVEAKLNSGLLKVEDIECEEFSSDTESGKAVFNNLKANKIDSDCASGLTTYKLIGAIDDYSYNLKASSGSISLGDTLIVRRDPYQTTGKEKSFFGRVSSGKMIIEF